MKKAMQISALVLFLVLNVYFFRLLITERSFEYRADREREVIDSIRHRYDSLMDRKVDSTAYFTFKFYQEAANRSVDVARHSEKIFIHEKDTVRFFTDSVTDSLLLSVR